MTLREYYQKLKKSERPLHPAQQFLLNLANKTGRSPKTIQQWLSGIQVPDPAVRKIIGEEVGLNPEELFPTCPSYRPFRQERQYSF